MKKQGATFRDFIATIRKEGKMAELRRPASLKLELAGVMAAFDGTPVYTERVAELMEALAPFANRAAEKGMGGKYSALTDSQWRRALETYQTCPGGDMCGCEPRDQGAVVKESLTTQPCPGCAELRETNSDHIGDVTEKVKGCATVSECPGCAYRDARIAAMTEDKERLDWLLETGCWIMDRGAWHKQLIRYACVDSEDNDLAYGDTPREAIDAARKAVKP